MPILPVLKSTVKKLLPPDFFYELDIERENLEVLSQVEDVRQVFDLAEPTDEVLPLEALEGLNREYPVSPATYLYDEESLESRGYERSGDILKMIDRHFKTCPTRILEVGCGDGMCSGILQAKGKIVTALDMENTRFDHRAIKAGVEFRHDDVHDMDLDNEEFDLVFSYNAMEHFKNPSIALDEMLRVLKPGGYIYLNFGPLYFAPKGLHAYREIGIPYVQVLFEESDIENFLASKGLEGLIYTNGWSIDRYRNLFKKDSDQFDLLFYRERFKAEGYELIARYPEVFKKQNKNFENYIVSNIELLIRKPLE